MSLSTKQVDKIHTPHLFYLPRMIPHPAWVADTDYVTGQYASFDGYEYIALEDHHSSALWGDDTLLWQRYGHIPYTETGREDIDGNPLPDVDHPIYDYHHQEETYASGKGLKRRAKTKIENVPVDQTANAYLVKEIGKWRFKVGNYYDGDLVATWELIPEYWNGSAW